MVLQMHRRPRALPDVSAHDMSEAQLQSLWQMRCQSLNLLWFHVWWGHFFHLGFPDLVLLGPGGLWFVELKSMDGTLSPFQERWRKALLHAGVNYAVHTPAQWLNGESEQLLLSIAGDADVIDLAAWRQAA